MSAGYSGTPLVKKLGYKLGYRALWLDTPDDYSAWLGGLPDGVTTDRASSGTPYDLVHLFARTLAEFDRQLPQARAALKSEGMIWVSWYKQAAKIPTDVTENAIRARALAGDLVDVKVCAVSDIWSGLKLVIRKALR
jgi:hypothetical protein